MKTKRFSVLQLILAVLLTAVVLTGGGLLALRAVVGQGGLALLEGLFLVHTRFVGDYDTAAVVDAALEGMVDGLGDRWSYYLTAEEYEAQNQRRKNQYVGIGVTVNYEREEGLLILEVTEGSPAAQAGLLAGELITAVDGQSLAGEARYDGADRIRGEAGSTLSLEVRAQTGQTRTVEVRRAALDSDPVEYELLEGQVGYVKLSNFYENSARRLEAAVTALQEQGARALVFDMRDNGGGYLTELTDMLDFLLNEGPIFISRDRQGHETVTESDADCVDLPMAVLVNANTYSAAEFSPRNCRSGAWPSSWASPPAARAIPSRPFRCPAAAPWPSPPGPTLPAAGSRSSAPGSPWTGRSSRPERETPSWTRRWSC